MATTFHESYGEVPKSLLRTMKKHNVTPSDFYMMEDEGLTHAQMEDAIVRFSENGMFSSFAFLMSPASLYK